MRKCQWLMAIFLLVSILVSCSKDSYHYPSVKEEFFCGSAKADGMLEYIITDDGTKRVVTEWGNQLEKLKPDTLFRLMGYYEELSADKVKVHSFVNAISSKPVPAVHYADSVPTAPIILHSAWLGNQYINMVLAVKSGGKKHRVVFLEEAVTNIDAEGIVHVVFSIHHNDAGDARVYEARGYASLPLLPYLNPPVRQLDITLKYTDYEGNAHDYSFVYYN